jgi:hypothetical protein
VRKPMCLERCQFRYPVSDPRCDLERMQGRADRLNTLVSDDLFDLSAPFGARGHHES